jgi:hypothetical protein
MLDSENMGEEPKVEHLFLEGSQVIVRGLAANVAAGKNNRIINSRMIFTSSRYVNNMYEYFQRVKFLYVGGL